MKVLCCSYSDIKLSKLEDKIRGDECVVCVCDLKDYPRC